MRPKGHRALSNNYLYLIAAPFQTLLQIQKEIGKITSLAVITDKSLAFIFLQHDPWYVRGECASWWVEQRLPKLSPRSLYPRDQGPIWVRFYLKSNM
jgi:hypothetical protein